MNKIIRRSVVMAAAAAPIAALSVVMSATGSAQLNCPPGQYWEPGSNTCKSAVPLACAPGEYWNPLTNLCRPLGQY